MMVPSKVENLLDLSNFSYVLVNAWQFLAMVNNTLQYLAMLDHYLYNAWYGVTYSRSWNEFTFILQGRRTVQNFGGAVENAG